jgi:hypothetical protein
MLCGEAYLVVAPRNHDDWKSKVFRMTSKRRAVLSRRYGIEDDRVNPHERPALEQQCHQLNEQREQRSESSFPFRIAQSAWCSPPWGRSSKASAPVPSCDRHPLHAGSLQSRPALLSTPMSDVGALRQSVDWVA